MTDAINFANCDYAILRATSLETPVKVIGDETRSGASMRRIGHTATVPTYDVTFKFKDNVEYKKFKTWFEEDDLNGYYNFWLPKIDEVNGDVYGYRFKPNTTWKANNTAGHVMQVTCILEEIAPYGE